MSSKINVFEIIGGHFRTLSDANTRKTSKADLFVFWGIPILLAVLCAIIEFSFTTDQISLLVNFGAVFIALLLSVLVLVYDQQTKIDDLIDKNQGHQNDLLYIKKELLEQLYYNLCYAIIISINMVIIAFAHSVLPTLIELTNSKMTNSIDFNTQVYLTTPLAIIFLANLILTIVMIVKRMHALLTSRA